MVLYITRRQFYRLANKKKVRRVYRIRAKPFLLQARYRQQKIKQWMNRQNNWSHQIDILQWPWLEFSKINCCRSKLKIIKSIIVFRKLSIKKSTRKLISKNLWNTWVKLLLRKHQFCKMINSQELFHSKKNLSAFNHPVHIISCLNSNKKCTIKIDTRMQKYRSLLLLITNWSQIRRLMWCETIRLRTLRLIKRPRLIRCFKFKRAKPQLKDTLIKIRSTPFYSPKHQEKTIIMAICSCSRPNSKCRKTR